MNDNHQYKGGRYRPENATIRLAPPGTHWTRTPRGLCRECGKPKAVHFPTAGNR